MADRLARSKVLVQTDTALTSGDTSTASLVLFKKIETSAEVLNLGVISASTMLGPLVGPESDVTLVTGARKPVNLHLLTNESNLSLLKRDLLAELSKKTRFKKIKCGENERLFELWRS